ncbi:class I SAM-dependent methyltransferase [Nocardia wallacei]|uniref:class I SAM-dependent methyltransferase n=1 Tax=Nocardia wallacei TaxID=480035 RepID=UPI00245432E8|nr:class I SAM-dependent methyltransferase [Nocardia wallacei]
MGIYSERVLPRIIDVACGLPVNERLRRRVCAGLRDRVVEIGFGSGHNVPYYPESVKSVTAVEPADGGWRLAAKRLAQSSIPVQRSGLDGQSLPFPDNSFDTALSTWTLCTIPEMSAALAEIRRVLVPGGTFHFVEHGLAPDAKVQTWQHRLNPVQKTLFGGCNLNRDIADAVEQAGFEVRELDRFYEESAPKFLGSQYLGVAVSP